jgi:hypothetical protein
VRGSTFAVDLPVVGDATCLWRCHVRPKTSFGTPHCVRIQLSTGQRTPFVVGACTGPLYALVVFTKADHGILVLPVYPSGSDVEIRNIRVDILARHLDGIS